MVERDARALIAHSIRLRQQRIRLWHTRMALIVGRLRCPEHAEEILWIGIVRAPAIQRQLDMLGRSLTRYHQDPVNLYHPAWERLPPLLDHRLEHACSGHSSCGSE